MRKLFAIFLIASTCYGAGTKSVSYDPDTGIVSLPPHGMLDFSQVLLEGIPGLSGGGGTTFPTVAQAGQTNEVWITLRTDGLDGTGSALDPFNGGGGNLGTKLRAIAAAHTTGSLTIHLGVGTYAADAVATPSYPDFPYGAIHSMLALTGSGDVRIIGAGEGLTVITRSTPGNVFDAFTGTAGALNLTVQDMTLKYTGGYSTGENACAILLGSGHVNSFVAERVELIDWTTSIYFGGVTYSAVARGRVSDCYFHYTHGRAGVAHGELGFPAVGILEAATDMVVRDNTWVGSDSLTYSGLPGSPPSGQQIGMDGLILTNSSGLNLTIENNIILNHSVEGVYAAYDANYLHDSDMSTIIKGNRIKAEPRTANNISYAPAIRADRQNGLDIETNTIDGAAAGILIVGNTYAQNVGVQTGRFTAKGNTLKNIGVDGVRITGVGAGGEVSNNTIGFWDSPNAYLKTSGGAAERNGVHIDGSSAKIDVFDNNITGGNNWWQVSTTVTSGSASDTLHVASSASITAGGFVLLIPATPDGFWRYGLVDSVTTGQVTINSGWEDSYHMVANAQIGDTIVFTPNASYGSTAAIYNADGTSVRAIRNKIAGIELGTSGTFTENSLNQIDSTVFQEVSGTVNKKVSGMPVTGNLIKSTTAGGVADSGIDAATVPSLTAATNTWHSTGFLVNRFNQTDGASNEKYFDTAWNAGAMVFRLLNDDLTIKATPIIIASDGTVDIGSGLFAAGGIKMQSTTLPANSSSNDGKFFFDGGHFYVGIGGTWHQIDN